MGNFLEQLVNKKLKSFSEKEDNLDVILIYPKGSFGDKGNNIQLSTRSPELYQEAKRIFHSELKEKFSGLNFFLQGDSQTGDQFWLMFESWSNKDELLYQAAKYLADRLGLSYDIV